MKTKIIFTATLFLWSLNRSNAQATTTISGVINTYVAVTSIPNSQKVIVNSSNPPFAACDKVLIIQMQGAVIDTSNTSSYGTITSYGNAGNYEFAYVSSVSGSAITFAAPLTRAYNVSGRVQVVKVPVYNNVAVAALLTCSPWNGSTGTGGVLAFDACHLTMQADISVSGKGFSGGTLLNGNWISTGHSDYVIPAPSGYGSNKGEGIFLMHATSQLARGCNGNGGGGANDIDGGGAGGSNFGAGGNGGNANYGSTVFFSGGMGGKALSSSYSGSNKIFMGGGGGAGHEDNNGGVAGGNGGGIIIIRAAQITGNSLGILADGDNVTALSNADGSGGGGAAGAILLKYSAASAVSNLQLFARGGKGGDDPNTGSCYGVGGGGSGGTVWSSFTLPASVSSNLSGGLAGVFLNSTSPCYGTSLGSSNGVNGGLLTNLNMITGNGACSQSPCPFNRTTGIENYENESWAVNVFPNPSNGSVMIEGLVDNEKISVHVTDITGKIVMNKEVSAVNGSYKLELPTEQSVYFLKLENSNKQVSYKKIIIAK